jgi:hypothetical protein
VGSNKQFNIILDECLERLLTGQETVEQCLQRYPEYGAELEPMLRTAMIMNKAVDVKPSADFRARARYQLQTMMAESKAPKRAGAFVPRWAVAVCAVLLVFVLGGGTVLAADGSMPGSPLYAVKLVTENVRVKLAGSEEKKVELYATMADRRVTEMAKMVDDGKTGNLEASAQRLNNYYAKISEFPPAQSSETNMLGATQSVPAPAFSASVPTETQPALMAPTTGGGTEVTDKSAIKTNETPAPVVTVIPSDRQMENNSLTDNLNTNSKTKLKDVLMYYSVIHPEKLQDLLDSDKVPEAVKPALRRALWASEHSYQQAIDNLAHY